MHNQIKNIQFLLIKYCNANDLINLSFTCKNLYHGKLVSKFYNNIITDKLTKICFTDVLKIFEKKIDWFAYSTVDDRETGHVLKYYAHPPSEENKMTIPFGHNNYHVFFVNIHYDSGHIYFSQSTVAWNNIYNQKYKKYHLLCQTISQHKLDRVYSQNKLIIDEKTIGDIYDLIKNNLLFGKISQLPFFETPDGIEKIVAIDTIISSFF